MHKLEELLTVKEVCYSERCGRTTVYKRINQGTYKAFKIGGSTRITVASIQAARVPKGAGNVS